MRLRITRPLRSSQLRHRSSSRSRSLRRVLDFAAYAFIGILVVLAAGAYGFHQAGTRGSTELPLKWIGFGGETAIIFGYMIREKSRLRRLSRFWFVLSSLLVAHLIVGFAILERVESVPLLLIASLGAIEFGALEACLGALLPAPRPPEERHR